ncbi:hypothetical protein AVEN_130001-1 [Araneus ventricosus]|uniref:Uncharacterized protein n=1 Tax=Araneus ventricosus TaxID=182803 RepID=A0A4Y2R4V3_ARAVE|nr:hypothetical protein AVEN_130001-1 [Araneus ventricosus]
MLTLRFSHKSFVQPGWPLDVLLQAEYKCVPVHPESSPGKQLIPICQTSSQISTSGTEPPLSEKTTDKDIRYYYLPKDQAYSTLYLSISKECRKLISDTDDGKQAWLKLKTRFEPSTRARIVALLDEYFSSRYIPCGEIRIFVAKLRDITIQLKDARAKNQMNTC